MSQWNQNQQQQQSQNQGDDKMIQWFGLWKQTSKNGNTYLAGTIGGLRVMIFPNGYKRAENQPDYQVYVVEKQRRDQDQQQQGDGFGGGPQQQQNWQQQNWQGQQQQGPQQQQQGPQQQQNTWRQPSADDDVPF